MVLVNPLRAGLIGPRRRGATIDLEKVSRSFAARDPNLHESRRRDPNAVEPEALLEWGYEARVECITLQGMGWRFQKSHTATTTQSHTERVTNPEDEEQYVDVEVIDQIRVRDEYGRVYTLDILR